MYYSYAPEVPASLESARDYFGRAISALREEVKTPSNKYFVGQAYAFWAEHEAYVGNAAETEAKISLAKEHWEGLPTHDRLVKELQNAITYAENGTPPRVPCPSLLMQARVSVPVKLAPEPLAEEDSPRPTPAKRPPAEVPPLGPAPSMPDDDAKKLGDNLRLLDQTMEELEGLITRLQQGQGKSREVQRPFSGKLIVENRTPVVQELSVNGVFYQVAPRRTELVVSVGRMRVYLPQYEQPKEYAKALWKSTEEGYEFLVTIQYP